MTQTYLVAWSMNIDAESPADAARQALGIHRDPESLATVFHISSDDGTDTVIDIEDPDEPVTLRKDDQSDRGDYEPNYGRRD